MKKGLLCLALILTAPAWTTAAATENTAVWNLKGAGDILDSIAAMPSDEQLTLHQLTLTGKIDSLSIRLVRERLTAVEILDLSKAHFLPDSIIPPYLFYRWYTLKTIVLPASIKEIREGAFYASGLETPVLIPAGVKRLGIGQGHRVYFDEESALLGAGAPDGDVVLHGVFEQCSNLRGVIFEEGSKLEEIGLKAFSRCINLEGPVTFPDGLKKIQSMAFFHCKKLKGPLNLPSGLISLGDEWMAIDTSRLGSGADEWERLHSGTAGAFSGCTGLTGNLTIPNGITFIPNGVFANCSGLNGVLTLPTPAAGKTLVIGASAFDGDSLLHTSAGELDLTHVSHIGMGAFRNCAHLNGILKLNPAITEIGQAAFSGCRSLTGTLVLPAALTHIGQVIGTTGSADGFSTQTGLYLRNFIWGSYDFSRYYTLANNSIEGAFRGTGFTAVYFDDDAAPQYHYLYEGTFADCSYLPPAPFPGSQYIHYLGKDADLHYTGLPQTLYVNPANNNDITDGKTWETAFRSIETAFDSLKANIGNGWKPVIYLAESDNGEAVRLNRTITIDFDTLTIRGGFSADERKSYYLRPGGSAPLIRADGPFSAFKVAGVKHIVLENVTIRDFEADNSPFALKGEGNGVTFVNAHFRDTTYSLSGNVTFNETLTLGDEQPTADIHRTPHLIHTDGRLTFDWAELDLTDKFQITADTVVITKKLAFLRNPWTPLENYPLLSATTLVTDDFASLIVLSSGYREDPNASFTWERIDGGNGDSLLAVTTVPHITDLIINPNSPTLAPDGDAFQLDISCEFPAVLDYATLEWISNMPLVAEVDDNGRITPGSDPGIVTITAIAHDPVTAATLDRTEITVYIVKVVPAPHPATLGLYADTILDVTIYPSYLPDAAIDWVSSDPTIATVDENGRIQTFGLSGEVVITASVRGHAPAGVTFPIKVSRLVKSISLQSSALGEVPIGGAVDIDISFLPEDAATKAVSWFIDNPFIAEIFYQTETSCRIRTLSEGATVLHIKTVDGSDLELFYTIKVVKAATALSGVDSNPVGIRYSDGILHLQGLDAYHGQILSAAGAVKADFPIQGNRFAQSFDLPAGLYLLRTTGAVTRTHKFVVK
ncbi:MAG: leucine-rich repeat protein [Tannerellaceae bacterium]|jgi:hypothetical protein|nr:leucine-rich repeat protein [Tannerellaceae bacterium]